MTTTTINGTTGHLKVTVPQTSYPVAEFYGDLVGMFRDMKALGISQEALDYALREAFRS